MSIVYFFTSGTAYFVGAGMIVVAVLVSLLRRTTISLVSVAVLSMAGLLLAFLSSPPTTTILDVTWFIAVVAWIGIYGRFGGSRHRVNLVSRAVVACLSMAAFALELPHHLAPDWSMWGFERVYVVGDSLSAGLGRESTWPDMLAADHGIDVTNLAVAGATAGSALKQADQIPTG